LAGVNDRALRHSLRPLSPVQDLHRPWRHEQDPATAGTSARSSPAPRGLKPNSGAPHNTRKNETRRARFTSIFEARY
jgi:hypothetical protein